MNRIFEYKWKLYKKCSNCNIKREVTEFKSNWYTAKWTKIYKPKCKSCFNLIERNSRILKTKQYLKIKETRNKYREENKDRFNKYNKKYYDNLSETQKNKIMKQNYDNRIKRNWFIKNKLHWIKTKLLRIIWKK